jgi:hypothetical protein
MQGPLLPVSLGGCPVIGECEVSVRLRGCELSGAPFRLPLLDSATPPSCQVRLSSFWIAYFFFNFVESSVFLNALVDNQGIFQRAFGSSGQGDGQLSNARGLAADHANQLLYVADYKCGSTLFCTCLYSHSFDFYVCFFFLSATIVFACFA